MSDIGELLAAEAVRLQPAHQPEFADLVRTRAARQRRNRVITGAALLVALGAGAGWAMLGDQPRDAGRPATVRAPAGSGPGSSVAVTGLLQRIGGPLGASPRGVSGTVFFRADNGDVISAPAAPDGTFSISVPAGRYLVTAS